MGSRAHYAPFLDDEDVVGIHDRSDPLGDDYLGGAGGLLVQGIAEIPVRLGVQRRERVIEQVDGGILAYGSRDGKPLLLSS